MQSPGTDLNFIKGKYKRGQQAEKAGTENVAPPGSIIGKEQEHAQYAEKETENTQQLHIANEGQPPLQIVDLTFDIIG